MPIGAHIRWIGVNSDRQEICDYEGSDYQERFWDSGARRYEDLVEEIALRKVLPANGRKLLEIGAGAGRNTMRYSGFEKIVLLDYARSQLEQAQLRLGKSERYLYVVADAYHLPFAHASFDAATMIRTLHHMVDPLAVLQEARGILGRGGIFVLEYANKKNLKAIARWILGRQQWNPFAIDSVEFAPLNFNFHPRAIRQWLRGIDFEVRRQLTVSHFRLNLLKRWVPLSILVALDSLIQWSGAMVQLTPSVFVEAQAKKGPTYQDKTFWRCPVCTSEKFEVLEEGLHCLRCGRTWSLREGIYDFKHPIRA